MAERAEQDHGDRGPPLPQFGEPLRDLAMLSHALLGGLVGMIWVGVDARLNDLRLRLRVFDGFVERHTAGLHRAVYKIRVMKKRMELLVRLVDGGQLYWDAAIAVDPLTVEEVDAMMPRTAQGQVNADVRKKTHELVRAKFLEAADQLFERALQRIR